MTYNINFQRPVCKDQILVEPSEQAYEQPIATAKEEQVHCIVKSDEFQDVESYKDFP